jgi:hypothetical protein
MKAVKTKMPQAHGLYAEMCDRVHGADIRLQYHAAYGNKAAMLAEARALLGQCSALVELLEGELRESGKFKG